MIEGVMVYVKLNRNTQSLMSFAMKLAFMDCFRMLCVILTK